MSFQVLWDTLCAFNNKVRHARCWCFVSALLHIIRSNEGRVDKQGCCNYLMSESSLFWQTETQDCWYSRWLSMSSLGDPEVMMKYISDPDCNSSVSEVFHLPHWDACWHFLRKSYFRILLIYNPILPPLEWTEDIRFCWSLITISKLSLPGTWRIESLVEHLSLTLRDREVRLRPSLTVFYLYS